MKRLILLILPFVSLNAVALSPECRESAAVAIKNLLQTDHKNVMSLQLDVAVAKLALRTKQSEKSSLESYIKSKQAEIEKIDEGKREELLEVYRQYGKLDDLDHVRKIYKESNYWDKELRLYNKDISPGVLLLSYLEEGTQNALNETDAAIIWLARKLSDATEKKYGRNSAKFNLTNTSTRVAYLLDRIKDGKNFTAEQIQQKLDDDKEKLKVAFESLKSAFLESIPDECKDEELNFVCTDAEFKDVYKEVLFRINEISLNDSITSTIVEQEVKEEVLEKESQVQNKKKETPSSVAESDKPEEDKNEVKVPVVAESTEELETKKRENDETVLNLDVVGINKDGTEVPWSRVPQVSILENAPLSEILEKERTINQFDAQEPKVHAYEQLFHDRNYSVIDKDNNMMTIYDKDGKRVAQLELEIEKLAKGDEVRTKDKKTLAAGRYSLRRDESGGNFLFLRGERDSVEKIKVKKTISSCGNKPGCPGSQQGAKIASYYLNDLDLGTLNTYVLPEENKLKFVAKDRDLKLADFSKEKSKENYNISTRDFKPSPIKFRMKPGVLSDTFFGDDSTSKREKDRMEAQEKMKAFLKTLEDDKARIMKIYNLDDAEYDQLAVMAIGMLGQESQFGDSTRYKIKEYGPGGALGQIPVSLMKWWKDYDDPNSRGLTQIKRLPKGIMKEYKMYFEPRGIASASAKYDKDIGKKIVPNYGLLKKPEYAARASMGFLAEALEYIKANQHKHPDIDATNRIDYIPTVYNKGTKGISNGTAQLDSSYNERIKSYSDNFDLHRLSTAEQIRSSMTISYNWENPEKPKKKKRRTRAQIRREQQERRAANRAKNQ